MPILLRELGQRRRLDHGRRIVAAVAEQVDAGLVVDLVGDAARLLQHRAAGLGVGVGVLGLALVVEALAERVDGDAELIVVAVHGVAAAVRHRRRLHVGRLAVDRRHVRALPVAGRLDAERQQHVQHLAGIVLAAAHLHQVGIGAEIARAHLGIGLEAAAAHDDGAACEIVFAFRRRDAHALDARGRCRGSRARATRSGFRRRSC